MQKLIVDLANKFKMTPDSILAMEQAYDFITRFAFIQNNEELQNCVMEIKKDKEFIYKDVPIGVKRIVSEALLKKGSYAISSFYSSHMKPVKFESFCEYLIKNKIQPNKLWEDGTITYKNLMYANSKSFCVEIVDYRA